MQRSFENRVMGGVCGGLAQALHINAWLVRVLFVLFAVLSVGAFVAAYLLLWWIVPQQSATLNPRRFPLLLALLVLAAAGVLWALYAGGQLTTADGATLYWPVLAVALSAVFFLRQLGGRAA